MRGLTFLIVIAVLVPFSFSVEFNELMYDFSGDDNNREFIELYSIQYTNLSGYIISDGSSNDTLVERKHFDSGYFLIVEDGFNYGTINASVYTIGATIGNNLGNNGDNLTLFYPNHSIISRVNYLSDWGANGNGYSLEKISPDLSNNENSWRTSFLLNGTPGKQNSVFGIQNIASNQLQITEIFPNPEGDDSDHEFIELYNPTSRDIDLKWSYLKDSAGHKFIITDMVAGSTLIRSKTYLAIRILGFQGLLNNDQDEIKLYSEDGTLIDGVSYAQPVEGNSYSFVDGYWQNTKPTPGEENIDYSKIKDSSIEISNIYDLGSDKLAEFGQTIRIRIKVYKGDSTKTELRSWIEDGEKLSKETTANLYSRYTNYELTLPVQIKPNCDDKFDQGTYDINVQGFDVSDKKTIRIEGKIASACDDSASASSSSKFSFNFAEYPAIINQNTIFTAKVEINGDKDPHDLELWSYVYRGSKTYSGEKEENKQKIHIPPDGSVIVSLQNSVFDAKSGAYKLKVKIRKDNQKTIKELTGDLMITEGISDVRNNTANENYFSSIFNSPKPFALSTIMFESSQRKAERLVPYFLGAIMTLTTLFLLFSRP